GGEVGRKALDRVRRGRRGNQYQQLVAIATLARTEAYPPRRAEFARELEKLLNGNDRLVAQQSTHALYLWATREQLESLLKALDDPNTYVRRGAIEALVPLKEKRAVSPVAAFLPKFGEREVAGRALIRMGPMVEAEVRKYVGHADRATREEAARVVRQIGKAGKDEDFLAALAGLKDRIVSNRRKALQWFAAASPEHPRRAEAAHEIARLLHEGNVLDKKEAALAL